MSYNILLYGATGYSGRLIAAELKRWNDATGDYRVVLAARDGERLKQVASRFGMDHKVFGLDEKRRVQAGLRGMDVVLNTAGPFALTARRLATVAISVGCSYVDINGEADVYTRLKRSLEVHAVSHRVALVSGAGFWAAASDRLVDNALTQLFGNKPQLNRELGAIRIAMSRIRTFTRASAATVLRSLREQVLVVRKGETRDADGKVQEDLVLWHEPVGKLERAFDFGAGNDANARDAEPSMRIASAASLVDTLAARLTAGRHDVMVGAIESYVEMDRARRFAYQLGSLFSPIAAIPAVRAMMQQPVALLAEGPTDRERRNAPHVVVLEIEDIYRSLIYRAHWQTPNVYDFTAQLAVAVASCVATRTLSGWRTPAEALSLLDQEGEKRAYRGTDLSEALPANWKRGV